MVGLTVCATGGVGCQWRCTVARLASGASGEWHTTEAEVAAGLKRVQSTIFERAMPAKEWLAPVLSA